MKTKRRGMWVHGPPKENRVAARGRLAPSTSPGAFTLGGSALWLILFLFFAVTSNFPTVAMVCNPPFHPIRVGEACTDSPSHHRSFSQRRYVPAGGRLSSHASSEKLPGRELRHCWPLSPSLRTREPSTPPSNRTTSASYTSHWTNCTSSSSRTANPTSSKTSTVCTCSPK